MFSLYKWDGVGYVANSNDDEVEVDINISYDIDNDDVGRFATIDKASYVDDSGYIRRYNLSDSEREFYEEQINDAINEEAYFEGGDGYQI
tara:strand:+ start:2216 stop:2485 length:270 start_codon:yes stop_codon:yes gene_type:complete